MIRLRTKLDRAPEDELMPKMIRLWNEGFSASEVAASCGFVSRQVVLGRIKRLVDKGDARITRLKDSRQARYHGASATLHIVKSDVKREPVKPAIPAPDASMQVSMLDATAGQCRYIVGEASEMICCGHAVIEGTSWCDFHKHRVFTKTPGSQQDRQKAQAASRNSGSMRQFG